MSTVLCPTGHASTATDYCDVCGEPIAASTSGAAGSSAKARKAAADPLAAATPSACPNCGAPAAPGALFCESCGYDFTTGVLPTPDPLDLSLEAPAPSSSAGKGHGTGSGQGPGTAGAGHAAGHAETATGAVPAVSTAAAGAASATVAPAVAAAAATTTAPAVEPASSAAATAGDPPWVVELWIDPDWYAAQAPEDPLPSVGLPTVVPLRLRSVLVGRPSRSRGITPEVDCGTDAGVSRRHCQLTTDGQRWWVEDLQSANGTYVAAPGAAMPTDPITPGERRELADGDRLYLGGWTRLVVRRALPGEV